MVSVAVAVAVAVVVVADVEAVGGMAHGNTNAKANNIQVQELQMALQQAIRSYERKGYLMIVIGLLINGPWMILLSNIHSNIEYNPNS